MENVFHKIFRSFQEWRKTFSFECLLEKKSDCSHRHTDREFVILNREFCKDCNNTTDQLRLTTYEFLHLLGDDSTKPQSSEQQKEMSG